MDEAPHLLRAIMRLIDRTRFRLLSQAVVNGYRLLRGTQPTERAVDSAARAPVSEIVLPAPDPTGNIPLEQVIAGRRSVRDFAQKVLTREQLSQLLWAAQGITNGSRRTAPSAGGCYPLELYVSVPSGFYHYNPQRHELELCFDSDLRSALYWAAQWRGSIKHAAAVFVIAAVYDRVARHYGSERSPLYVHLEAGHAAQNLLLQATALGLGSVPIGGFYDDQVEKALGLPNDHEPIYLIAVGYPEKAAAH